MCPALRPESLSRWRITDEAEILWTDDQNQELPRSLSKNANLITKTNKSRKYYAVLGSLLMVT